MRALMFLSSVRAVTGGLSTAIPCQVGRLLVNSRALLCPRLLSYGRFVSDFAEGFQDKIVDPERFDRFSVLNTCGVADVVKWLGQYPGVFPTCATAESRNSEWLAEFAAKLQQQWHLLNREERRIVCFCPCPVEVHQIVATFISRLSFSEQVDVYVWTWDYWRDSIRARDPQHWKMLLKNFSSVEEDLQPSTALRAFSVACRYRRQHEQLYFTLMQWLLKRTPEMSIHDLCQFLKLYRPGKDPQRLMWDLDVLPRSLNCHFRCASFHDALELAMYLIQLEWHCLPRSSLKVLEKRVESEWDQADMDDCCKALHVLSMSTVAEGISQRAMSMLWSLNPASLVYLISYLTCNAHKVGFRILAEVIPPLFGQVKLLGHWHVSLLSEMLTALRRLYSYSEKRLVPELANYFAHHHINMDINEIVHGASYFLMHYDVAGCRDILLQLQHQIADQPWLQTANSVSIYLATLRHAAVFTAPTASFLNTLGYGRFCTCAINIFYQLHTLHMLRYGPPALVTALGFHLLRVVEKTLGSSKGMAAKDFRCISRSLVSLAWLSGGCNRDVTNLFDSFHRLISSGKLLLGGTNLARGLWAFLAADHNPLVPQTSQVLCSGTANANRTAAGHRLDLHWYGLLRPDLGIEVMSQADELRCVEIMQSSAAFAQDGSMDFYCAQQFAGIWGVGNVLLRFGILVPLVLLLSIHQMCFVNCTRDQVPQSPAQMIDLHRRGLYATAVFLVSSNELIKPAMTLSGFTMLKQRQLSSLGWLSVVFRRDNRWDLCPEDIELLASQAARASRRYPVVKLL